MVTDENVPQEQWEELFDNNEDEVENDFEGFLMLSSGG